MLNAISQRLSRIFCEAMYIATGLYFTHSDIYSYISMGIYLYVCICMYCALSLGGTSFGGATY